MFPDGKDISTNYVGCYSREKCESRPPNDPEVLERSWIAALRAWFTSVVDISGVPAVGGSVTYVGIIGSCYADVLGDHEWSSTGPAGIRSGKPGSFPISDRGSRTAPRARFRPRMKSCITGGSFAGNKFHARVLIGAGKAGTGHSELRTMNTFAFLKISINLGFR
jgi:hypothetical protein